MPKPSTPAKAIHHQPSQNQPPITSQTIKTTYQSLKHGKVLLFCKKNKMGGYKRSFSGISSSHSSSSGDWEMNNSGVPTITTPTSTARSRATSAATTKPSSLSSEPTSKKTKTSHEIGENQEDDHDHDHDSEVKAPRLQVKKVRGWTAFISTRNNNNTTSSPASPSAASECELSDTIKWPGEGPRRTSFTCALCFATRVTHGRPYCRTCTSTLALAHRNPTLTEDCIWCFEPLEDILHVVCQKCKDSLRIASSPRKNKSHGADDD